MDGEQIEQIELFDLPRKTVGPGPIETVATRTLRDMEAKGLLSGVHQLRAALAMQLARSIDEGVRAQKVSIATATLVRELIDLLDTLPAEVAVSSDWSDLVTEIRNAS